MKSILFALTLKIAFLANVVGAKPNQSFELSAERLYQQGLYFQHTVGDLDAALEAYDQALAMLIEKKDQPLKDSIHLRRVECLNLLGRSQEHSYALAAFRKQHSSKHRPLDLTKYFPPQTDLMFQLDLKSLKASPLFERLKLLVDTDQEELQKLTAILGFDPLTMLQKVSAAISLSSDREMPLEHWLVLGEGDLKDFQPDVIIEPMIKNFLEKPKKKAQKDDQQIFRDITKKNIRGVTVWSAKISVSKHKQAPIMVGLAKLDDRSVVIGDLVSMRHFLAARAGKSPGLIANKKLSHLGPLVPKGAFFWLATVPTEIMLKFDKIKQSLGTANLPALDTVLLSGKIDKDLHTTAVAWATDNESAKKLSDIAHGLIALAQMFRTEKPLVDKLLKSLRVETKDLKVTVSVTLPGDLIAQSANLKKAFRGEKPTKPRKPKPAKPQPEPKPEPKPASKPKPLKKS